MAKRIIVLGATGSIGRQTLQCIEAENRISPGSFEVVGLSAHRGENALAEAGAAWPRAAAVLSSRPGGAEALDRMIRDTDAELAVNGIAGAAGLAASVAALESGKDLALANKESVVMAWSLLSDRAARHGSKIVPVDSEHAALFQLVNRLGSASIDELCITASGGPFRDKPVGELAGVTPDQAAKHPTWNMGRKISIDSATLANKGLELIEAVRLFGVPESKVRVLVHPESIVHALVRTVDGALYAHLSEPDMRLPIDVALHWPEERACPFGRLDLAGKTLRFQAPDDARYPMLALARRAAAEGEGATIAFNAADEVAVAAFERGEIGFMQIAELVRRTLDSGWITPEPDLGSILHIDAMARDVAKKALPEMHT